MPVRPFVVVWNGHRVIIPSELLLYLMFRVLNHLNF